MNEHIKYQVDGSTATITLDRPDKLNAFVIAMGEEIIAALDQADADDAVRCIVVTGAGRGFCAGADLSDGTAIFDRDDPSHFDMAKHADFGGLITRRILTCRKPIIAAINGPAVGIGITMTLAMDIRLVSTRAKIGFVFGRVGIVPEAASTWLLPRIVGISRAAEWIYSGRVFDAKEAQGAGLVRSIHEPDELLDAAYALAAEFTHTAPVATAIARSMLWDQFRDGSPELAHELDSLALFHLGRSSDAEAGIAAFISRASPHFALRVSSDLPSYVHQWHQNGTWRQARGHQ